MKDFQKLLEALWVKYISPEERESSVVFRWKDGTPFTVSPQQLNLTRNITAMDGNCFYHAFIFSKWGACATTKAADVKAVLVQNFTLLKKKITEGEQQWDNALVRLRSINDFAQNEEIEMVAEFYNTRINVWIEYVQTWRVFIPTEFDHTRGDVVYVKLIGDVNEQNNTLGIHFESLTISTIQG